MPTTSSATSPTASIVANVRCATNVTTTATRMSAKTATTTQTADPLTTIPTISASVGKTAGTPICSTVQSKSKNVADKNVHPLASNHGTTPPSGTGTAARRREPTSSVPPDLSTNQTRCNWPPWIFYFTSIYQSRCSATGRIGLTVEADPLVIRVTKTANKVMRFSTLCFLNIFVTADHR